MTFEEKADQERAERIVTAIERELKDRRGIGHEWNACAPDIQEEIHAALVAVVIREL